MGGFSQTTFGFFNTGVGSTPPPTDPAIVVVGAGANSTVRCGLSNTASGGRSTVFGYNNTASGVDSAVYGGTCHTAAGNFSFIGGGNINIAANVFATVVGGQLNAACQRGSFIGGGINNIVNTTANTIYGGSVIAGGVGNNTTGGTYNESLGCFTVAPTLCLAGQYSFIGGGFQNLAQGGYSFLGGGSTNNAANQYATVVGGTKNTACLRGSFIGGGIQNSITTAANNTYSGAVVVGGIGNNTAGGAYSESTGEFTVAPTVCQAGQYSFIGGGIQNLAKGILTTVVAGSRNIACANYSVVVSGLSNCVRGEYGFIGGGFCNSTFNTALYSAVLGGCANTLNHACSFIVGSGITTDEALTSFFNNIKTGGARYGYAEKTANYTIVQADYTINVTANSPTITLPTAVGISGKVYVVKNTGAGTVTLATTSAQTIDGAATQSIAANTSLMVQSTNANWIII